MLCCLPVSAGARLDHNATGAEVDGERLGAASLAAEESAVVVLPLATGNDYCQVQHFKIDLNCVYLWYAASCTKPPPAKNRSHPPTKKQTWRVSFWSARTILPRCAAPAADDAAFLSDLIPHLTATLAADSNRVYLSGFSNGAMAVQEMLCRRPDVAAALLRGVALLAPALGADFVRQWCSWGAVVGRQQSKGGGAGRRRAGPAVLVVHGTADPTLPFGPGQRIANVTMLGAGGCILWWLVGTAFGCQS